MDVRLVHANTGGQQTFTMYRDGHEVCTLSDDQTEQLLDKLSRMEVSAPWRPHYGCDGIDYELTLQGAMSSMIFCWWSTVPPEWESVGELFDYVHELARIRSQPE
jgi:hypothetical protein